VQLIAPGNPEDQGKRSPPYQVAEFETTNVRNLMDGQPAIQSMSARYRGELPARYYGGSSWYLLRRGYFLRVLSSETKKKYRYVLAVLDTRPSEPLPSNVRSGLRHYAVMHGRMKAMERLIIEPLTQIVAMIGLSVYITASVILANHENIPMPFVGALGGFCASVVILFACVYALPGRTKVPAFSSSPILTTIAALAIKDSLLRNQWPAATEGTPGSKLAREAAYLLFMTSAFSVIMIAMTSIIVLADAIVIGRYRRRCAHVGLLDLLIQARRSLIEHDARMSDPSFKSYVLSILERSAIKVENDLGRSVFPSDPRLQSEIMNTMRQAAAELRAMQLRLALSDYNTMREVRDGVTSFIFAVASGSYALLPTAALPTSRGKSRKVVAVGREVIISVTPLAVLAASKYLRLDISPGVWNWAVIISLIWAAITLISLLDPLYKSKIADLRDIISIIRSRDH
jgi:hypothetical protein